MQKRPNKRQNGEKSGFDRAEAIMTHPEVRFIHTWIRREIRCVLLKVAKNAGFVERFMQQSINFESISVSRPAV